MSFFPWLVRLLRGARRLVARVTQPLVGQETKDVTRQGTSYPPPPPLPPPVPQSPPTLSSRPWQTPTSFTISSTNHRQTSSPYSPAIPFLPRFLQDWRELQRNKKYLSTRVTFLSAEDMHQVRDQESIRCGAYGQVQTVTFRGQKAVMKSMFKPKYLKVLVREARVVVALGGAGGAPRVLALTTQPPAVIFEFVGETCADFLSRCRPVSSVLHVLAAACERLHEIHQKGYTHCDIKVDNICLQGDEFEPSARLIDFGLATRVGAPFDNHFVGVNCEEHLDIRPEWLSPEMLAGQPLQPSSDVYSVGMMMKEILGLEYNPRLAVLLLPVISACTDYNPARRPSLPLVAGILREILSTLPPDFASFCYRCR